MNLRFHYASRQDVERDLQYLIRILTWLIVLIRILMWLAVTFYKLQQLEGFPIDSHTFVWVRCMIIFQKYFWRQPCTPIGGEKLKGSSHLESFRGLLSELPALWLLSDNYQTTRDPGFGSQWLPPFHISPLTQTSVRCSSCDREQGIMNRVSFGGRAFAPPWICWEFYFTCKSIQAFVKASITQ